MRFRILGTLEASDDGAAVPLGRPKQRVLLAVLLCRRNEIVSTAELIDAVWGGCAPASAAGNVRSYVHGLRKALGADLITGHGRPGYRLVVAATQVDADQFIDLAARGATALAGGDVATARVLLHDALRLWRDRPFADMPDVPVLGRAAAQLDEQRLLAVQHRVDADLRAGRADELIAEVRDLVAAHPYREPFRRQLMLALYRSGQQADALAAYRDARHRLRRDLGTEPSDELRALEVAMLRRDPDLTAPVRDAAVTAYPVRPPIKPKWPAPPAELPPAHGYFAGRDTELDQLDQLTRTTGVAGVVPVVVVVGPPGVGKTALAVNWAHRAVHRYPDGQLFLDLRGFHVGPAVAPHESVTRLLRSLGVEPDRQPVPLDEAVTLYRSLLAHQRVLVVLDNAASADQVRHLLPGGSGCAVLVTSRNQLTGLSARNGARHTVVEPLAPGGALDVLHQVLGGRTHAEPEAAAALAEACGYLPLALRIAAAHLAERPDRTIAEHVADLRAGDRLDRLQVDGDDQAAMRQTIDLSYATLGPDLRRAFRLLGQVPGPDFAAPAIAALVEVPVAEAERMLDCLADAHLVHREPADRFSLHDLVREYARGRVQGGDPAEREAALARLFDFYGETAHAAACRLYPQMARLPAAARNGDRPGSDGPADAAAWLAVELPNLTAAVAHAAEHPPHRPAWVIADALRGFFWHRRDTAQWAVVGEAAARAAALAGDALARAATELSLAHRATVGRDYDQSIRRHATVLDLSLSAGWDEGEATALSNLAVAYAEKGELRRSREHMLAALTVNRRIGWRPGEAVTLCNLGQVASILGALPDAVAYYGDAMAAYRDIGSDGGQAVALTNLAEVHLLMDQPDVARTSVEEAQSLAWRIRRLDTEAHALIQLSGICRETGTPDVALRHAGAALELISSSGDRLLSSMARTALAAAHLQLGDAGTAVEQYAWAHRLAAEIGNRHLETAVHIEAAAAAHRLGDVTAPDTAARALSTARLHGYGILEGRAHAVLAELLAGTDRAAAAEHARAALRVQDRTGWRLGRRRLRRLADPRRGAVGSPAR
jgi:DNA-binding SARP family transcriptional activator/tetratricopeptide (TPR) repeat protein